MLVCIPVVVFTWLARTSRTMHVRRGFSMRTVFLYGLRAFARTTQTTACTSVATLASRPPVTQVTSSPRGHVVVVVEAGAAGVELLVVEAAAAGSGELLVVVAGAAGVELLVAVAGASAEGPAG